MENYEIHPTIDNAALLEKREELEGKISNLRVEIGKNQSFIEDPLADEAEKENVRAEIVEQEKELVELMGDLEKLNLEYNDELAKKVAEIEQSFEEAA